MKPPSRTLKLPRYQHVRAQIVKLLEDESYLVGDAIPSVGKLAKQMSESHGTVQKAVEILSKEGVLRNVRGSGCFVQALPQKANFPVTLNFGVSGARRRLLKIGMHAGELAQHRALWEEIFADYVKTNSLVDIEVVPLDDASQYTRIPDLDLVHFSMKFLPYLIRDELLFRPGEVEPFDLSAEGYYPAFCDAVTFGGETWGVPLIAASICQFVREDEGVEEILAAHDFWGYLDAARRAANSTTSRWRRGLIANEHYLSLTLQCLGVESGDGVTRIPTFDNRNYIETLKRLQNYFRDRRLFKHDPCFQQINLMDALDSKAALIWSSSSCWEQLMCHSSESWSLRHMPCAAQGHAQLDGSMLGISRYSPFPVDALELLRHLSTAESQGRLARSGRMVCQREAMRELRVAGIDERSREQIDRAFEQGRVDSLGHESEYEFHNQISTPLVETWVRGDFDAEVLFEKLQQQSRFFFQAKDLQRSRAG